MNADEVARILNVSGKTIDRWVRQGLLPAHGSDRASFDPAEIRAWAAQRGLALHGEDAPAPDEPTDPFAAALNRGVICPNVSVGTATEAIEAAVQSLTQFGDEARERILHEVLDREHMASTALGSGIAIPHPRTPAADLIAEPVITVLYLSPVIDWAAPDNEPVHTAFLLLSPDPNVHLRILSKIARAMRAPGFCAFLSRQPTKAELVEQVRQLDLAD